MKQQKRRLEILSFYDATGIAAHLEAMAQKGWALEKIRNSVWHYRRIEPKLLRYAVVYLPSSSEFDSGPTPASQELQAFCARAGWVQTGTQAQMHIFCNEDPNAIPIETDPELQVEVIHRAMKKNFIPSQITMLILSILQILLSCTRLFSSPISFLSSNANLVGALCWLLIIAMSVNDLVKYYTWRRTAVLAARDGAFLPTRGSQKFQKFCLWAVIGGFLMWVFGAADAQEAAVIGISVTGVTVLYGAVFGIKSWMKKRGTSTGATRTAVWITAFVMAFLYIGGITFFAIKIIEDNWFEPKVETYEYKGHTFELHHDEIPLRLEDLTEVGDEVYSTKLFREGSIFLTHISATQNAKMGSDSTLSLGYNIYDVHFSPLKKLARQAVIKGYDNEGDDFVSIEIGLDGVQVYRYYQWGDAYNTLLICYDSRYVLLHPGWEMTDAQIQTAAQILAP